MSPLACCKDCPTKFDCVEEGCKRAKGKSAPPAGKRTEDGGRNDALLPCPFCVSHVEDKVWREMSHPERAAYNKGYEHGYANGRAHGARWIPVTERLPKHMEHVIVEGGIAYWRDPSPEWPEGKFYTVTACDWPGRPIQWDVTHWMPMPSKPNAIASNVEEAQ